MGYFIKNVNPKRLMQRRGGAAAVEFALVAPLFFLLLGGIVEVGQAYRIEHALSHASRRSARSAVIGGVTSTQIKDRARAHCESLLGVKGSNITVVVSVNGVANSSFSQSKERDEIDVKISIPYSKASLGLFAQTLLRATISSNCTL